MRNLVNRAAVALVLLLAACAEGAQNQDREGGEPAGTASAPSAVARVGEETGLVLDSATVQRLGLATAPLAAQTGAAERELPAVVVEDPASASTVRTGIAGRLSEVPGTPWPGVGTRLEASSAVAQVGDARPVTVPKSGTVVRILAQPGELVQAGQPLLELVDYTEAVARIAWEEGTPPVSLRFSRSPGGARVTGQLLGPAPEADPLTRAPAWIYRLSGGGTALRPGVALIAFAPEPGPARHAVLIPSRAMVQWDALAWAYVERAPGKFVRVRVPTARPVPGGWLVEQGFRPGERVVVTGAGLLLSEEFRSRIVVGEEVGE